jgi:hypothetical protein
MTLNAEKLPGALPTRLTEAVAEGLIARQLEDCSREIIR